MRDIACQQALHVEIEVVGFGKQLEILKHHVIREFQ